MRLFLRRYQENTVLLNVCKYAVDVMMTIVTAYVLVTFICCQSTVAGNSMNDVLADGNTVLINRISYVFSNPDRYDCIAFEQDSIDSSRVYIKRVIGLPGETVQIIDGKVYINGEELADDVVDTRILTEGIAASPYTLGEDEYFVLGDNRNSSEDSRFASVGMVKKSNIVGKVWLVISPFDAFGIVE